MTPSGIDQPLTRQGSFASSAKWRQVRVGGLGGSAAQNALGRTDLKRLCRHSHVGTAHEKRRGGGMLTSRGRSDWQLPALRFLTKPFPFTLSFSLSPGPSHYDPPPSVPGGVVVSQLCWRRAFPCPPREEACPPRNGRLCSCCGCNENQVRLPSPCSLQTPEHCGHSSHQPSLSFFRSPNPHLTSITICRTVTPAT